MISPLILEAIHQFNSKMYEQGLKCRISAIDIDRNTKDHLKHEFVRQMVFDVTGLNGGDKIMGVDIKTIDDFDWSNKHGY